MTILCPNKRGVFKMKLYIVSRVQQCSLFRAVLSAGLAIGLVTSALIAATPVTITSNQHGIVGVAASTSQLLFTQPFCQATGITRGVYSVNTTTGVPSLYSVIPEAPGECTENYIALATTLNSAAGFT